MDTTEPRALLLRRGDVLKWLGLPESEFKKLVRAGVVRGRALRPGGRLYFSKDHIREALLAPLQSS